MRRLKINPEFIQAYETYKSLFDEAYPNIPVEESYTKLYSALVKAAYERIVVSSEAPFQKWFQSEKYTLNESEKQGAMLFFGKGQYYTCHLGPTWIK